METGSGSLLLKQQGRKPGRPPKKPGKEPAPKSGDLLLNCSHSLQRRTAPWVLAHFGEPPCCLSNKDENGMKTGENQCENYTRINENCENHTFVNCKETVPCC